MHIVTFVSCSRVLVAMSMSALATCRHVDTQSNKVIIGSSPQQGRDLAPPAPLVSLPLCVNIHSDLKKQHIKCETHLQYTDLHHFAMLVVT